MGCNVQAECRLPHGWPSRDNDHVTRLETGRHPVHIDKACGHARDHFLSFVELLDVGVAAPGCNGQGLQKEGREDR